VRTAVWLTTATDSFDNFRLGLALGLWHGPAPGIEHLVEMLDTDAMIGR
jgi:hypothetical protein